jgi:hypothetical protein
MDISCGMAMERARGIRCHDSLPEAAFVAALCLAKLHRDQKSLPVAQPPGRTTGEPQREVAGVSKRRRAKNSIGTLRPRKARGPLRARLVTHAQRRQEALQHSARLVASGLRRIAAICNVLQGCREKSFNSLRVLTYGRELLICGLWVRFPPGSPLIPKDLATSTTRRLTRDLRNLRAT